MDTSPSADTRVTVEQFSRSLTESGLLSAEEVKSLTERIPPNQRQDCRSFAQELIKQQKLTKYQAAMLFQGKTKGLVLGNYVLMEKLGQGGMGMVFKASHRKMGRVVALKVLSPSVTKNPRAVKRFQREAHAAAQLQHPSIVAAYDAGEDKGIHFLVMEYVDGSDLSSLVKKQGPLPIAQAVDCILQAAGGLEHAHAAGIVHRDIKPSNLLLAKGGGVKVLDMGLARFDSGGNSTAPDELTQSGSIMGTCDYMAPEQALNSKHADQRSDIYSLGCTLYYLVTGKVMYAGETSMEKLLAHRETPTPPLPGASKTLQAVYRRMVAKAPEERYQSMSEAISGLVAGSKGQPLAQSAVRKQGRSSGTHWLVGASAALLLAGLGFFTILIARFSSRDAQTAARPTESPPTRNSAPPPVGTPGVDEAWIRMVQRLPPERQVIAVDSKLREMNYGYATPTSPEYSVDKGVVVRLHLPGRSVPNLAALRTLPLYLLDINDCKVSDLSPLRGMKLTDLNAPSNSFSDLSPLAGMPLRSLAVWNNKNLADLSPLRGMTTLTRFSCSSTKVTDLSPLQNLPLKELSCDFLPERDAAILRSIRTLEKINDQPAPEFWKEAEAKKAALDAWIKSVQAMPANKQFEAVREELTRRNRGYAGKWAAWTQHMTIDNVVVDFTLHTDAVTDLSPLKALKGLQRLTCTGTAPGKGTLADLTPLRDLPLTFLNCECNPIRDLTPLQGMRLTRLVCNNTHVTDLSPLKGMPLGGLECAGTPVSDLSPLQQLPLRWLSCPVSSQRNARVLQSIKSLETINGKPAAEFWKGFSPKE
jgi:serine/threonine protein kinase